MLIIIFGIISGIITGLGMGGGTILILLLSVFYKTNQHVAQAINLFFFLPTSISAILINIKKKNIDYNVAGKIVFSGVIGAIIGATIAQKMSSNNLRKYFAIFIIIIAIHEMIDLFKEYRNKIKRNNKKIRNL